MQIKTTIPIEEIANLGDLAQAVERLYAAHAPATAAVSINVETRYVGYGTAETAQQVATGLTFTWEP